MPYYHSSHRKTPEKQKIGLGDHWFYHPADNAGKSGCIQESVARQRGGKTTLALWGGKKTRGQGGRFFIFIVSRKQAPWPCTCQGRRNQGSGGGLNVTSHLSMRRQGKGAKMHPPSRKRPASHACCQETLQATRTLAASEGVLRLGQKSWPLEILGWYRSDSWYGLDWKKKAEATGLRKNKKSEMRCEGASFKSPSSRTMFIQVEMSRA